MIIGVSGLCLGFLLGGLALVAALGFVLQRSVDAEAVRTGADVAALVDAGPLPQPVPVAGGDRVQVIDAQNRVRSASIDADRLVPMLSAAELSRLRAGQRLYLHTDRMGLTGPVRVVGVPAGPASDPQLVVVARSMSDVLRGLGVLRTVLLIGFPILVVSLSGVAWRAIGATLRPVEALRRGAEEITGTGRAARLPVPAGDDEIHRLAITLNGMLDRLESGRSRQREFVADAAHELRSPLANMRTQVEVAQRLGPGAPWPEIGADLLADVNRLARLVDDLLLLARADETVGLTRSRPVSLAALLTDIGARYPSVRLDSAAGAPANAAALAGASGAMAAPSIPGPDALTTRSGPDGSVTGNGLDTAATRSVPDTPTGWDGSLTVLGEPDALSRVLANLLDNAVRHARSSVSLAARADGDDVLLTVTDDGPGIPADDRARVFERFTRLDDARARDGGGAGLGLAIVAELVRQHSGTVTLSDAQPGLRVDVRLPRARLS